MADQYHVDEAIDAMGMLSGETLDADQIDALKDAVILLGKVIIDSEANLKSN